ncbi:diacylglycerol kinase family protein [Microbacterium neungamense]|uniref:diacylglycerol kinase family protein n=1 Tax=Microbacterium TaxID=33882 RepID=UPI003D815CF1
MLEEGDDIAALVRDAVASSSPPRVLGVWGGDGSVAAVADAARRVGLPLLVLPGGTFNHFARTAGVPTIEDGIEALRTGSRRCGRDPVGGWMSPSSPSTGSSRSRC